MLYSLLFSACPAPEQSPTEADVSATGPTWHADVAPVIERSCVGCHTAGGVAPFALDTYTAAAPMAAAMAMAVGEGRMPPWGAVSTEECTPRYGWKDDLRLSDAEKALIAEWAETGAAEGDAAFAADLPGALSLALDGANQSLTPVTGFEASGSGDQFMCFTLDPGLASTRWLTGVQIAPGNDAVVHHALIFADPEGASLALAGDDGVYECFGGAGFDDAALIGAWAPGSVANEVPEGSGMEITAGSRIVMQIHYHPAGESAGMDQTTIDLRWTDTEPEMLATLALIGNSDSEENGLLPGPNDDNGVEFRIPANATGHTEEMTYTVGRSGSDYGIFLAGTHMHYVGTDMAIWLERSEPDIGEDPTECLVQTPKWDFNWQRGYTYDAAVADLPRLNKGDTLRLRCTYDNTLANAGVQQSLEDAGLTEPSDVYLGDETLDEMCLGVFGVLY